MSPYSCFNLNLVLWLDCLGVKGRVLKKMKKVISETKKGGGIEPEKTCQL